MKIDLDLFALLESLVEHDVDFIVVGGVCAVIHGAPLATFDLDVVHARTDQNIGRLLAALLALDARYRGQGGRIIRPDAAHLSGPGHQLLMTCAGPLDILGEVGSAKGYTELLGRSHEVTLSGKLAVRVLDLEALIELKQEAGRPKDLAVLPTLRSTLAERRRQ